MDKNDLISRSAMLKETIRAEGYLHMPNGRVMHVECIPVAFIVEASAVDPEELRPRGKWEIANNMIENAVCSCCGRHFQAYYCDYKYCPRCGAKMEG